MSQGTFDDIHFKAMNGQFNIDEAQGIVECFVAAVGNKDSVGDIVASGAFTESLKRRKPRVVWGHNWNDPIGKVLEIYEVPAHDPRLPGKMKQAGVGGLYAKVQFNLATEKGREAFASVAFFGGDQEWSIGYKTLQANFDSAMQANVLREVELYEVSPVLHGANQLTATISVKSDEGEKCHTPAMSDRMPMMPAVMRAFKPGVPEGGLSRILANISEDISNPREDIFAEGEARELNREEIYRLEEQLMLRSNNRLKVISATENMVTFHRMLPNGSSTAYRLPYHRDTATGQYMFGKPEKMGQASNHPQPLTVVPTQMPSMPMSVKPNAVSAYTMVNGQYDGEKSVEEKLYEVIADLKLPLFDDEVVGKSQQDKIEEILSLLQSYVEEKSEPMRVIMKCEPHQAFYVKELLDPVIAYHGLQAEVSEKGVHLSGTFSDETLDALYASEKSIQRMLMKEGGWGKGDGPSGPTFELEVKALGGRVGQRIGGGISAAPPGMVWVDITGAIDGDSDGIVFEGTPMQRPIIPRAMIPQLQASVLQQAALPRAIEMERNRVPKSSVSREDSKPDLNPVPKKNEVDLGAPSKPLPKVDNTPPTPSRVPQNPQRRNVRKTSSINPNVYDPWVNRDSGTERSLGNEFSVITPLDDVIDSFSSRSKKLTPKEIIDNLAYFNNYRGLNTQEILKIFNNNGFSDMSNNELKNIIDDIITAGGKFVLLEKSLLVNLSGNKLILDLSKKDSNVRERLISPLKQLYLKKQKTVTNISSLSPQLNYLKPELKRLKEIFGDSFIIRVQDSGHYSAVLIDPITGDPLKAFQLSGSPSSTSQLLKNLSTEFTNAGTARRFEQATVWKPAREIIDKVPLRGAYEGEPPKFGPLNGNSKLAWILSTQSFSEDSTEYPNALVDLEIHDIGDGRFGVYGVIVSEDGIEHLVNQEQDNLAFAFDFVRALGSEHSQSTLSEMRDTHKRRMNIVEQLGDGDMTEEVQEMQRARDDRSYNAWYVSDSSRSQRTPSLAYNTAAKSIRDIFDDEDMWDPFFKDLNRVLEHSQKQSQRLLDLYDDPNASEEAITNLEESIRKLDEQIAAVIDYAKFLNGENRRARLKKLAIPLVQKMIDERDGADYGDFTDEEIDLLRDRLTYTDQLIQDIFGTQGSDKAKKFVELMQDVLDDAEWYDGTLSSPIEDENNPDYLENPSQELLDDVLKSLNLEITFIKDARKRNHQQRLAISGKNNLSDGISRSRRSFINGRGMGETRQIFPNEDKSGTSKKIKYVRYDGRKEELSVEYSSGEIFTYGGITDRMVSAIEKSPKDIDSGIDKIKEEARYSIKPDGQIDGTAVSIAKRVERDIERLEKYDVITGLDKMYMLKAREVIMTDFAEEPEHELVFLSEQLEKLANKLSREYGENSAALNLLEIKSSVDDRIGNGLGGTRGTRMYRPLQKETTLDLTNDEIGELRDEMQSILNKHGDRMTFEPFAEFDKALKDAQDANKNSVTINNNLHSALNVAYDELHWMASHNQAEKRWLTPLGETPLNIAAASGRFISPRLSGKNKDSKGKPFGNGAPFDMSPEFQTHIMDWANGNGAGLQVLKNIRESYRRNGYITTRQWRTLANMYRRFGPGGSDKYYGIVPSDIPDQLDDEAEEGAKPAKPLGKPASELLPSDFDSLTAKEKIDVMFQIGRATKDNPDGIMAEDWNRLIYPLDKELDVEESVQNQAEFMAAQEAAAMRGEILTEEQFYENKSRKAQLQDRRTIQHALSEYDAGRPGLLQKLGLRRENFIIKADREYKAPTTPKPLGKWALDFSMKVRSQIEKAVSNGLAGEEHLDPWLSMEELINENNGLLDEETIQNIIPILEEYVDAYNGAEFGHRSEGNSFKYANDMIQELENTLSMLLDPTTTEDDSSDDADDKKDVIAPPDAPNITEEVPPSTDNDGRSLSRRPSSTTNTSNMFFAPEPQSMGSDLPLETDAGDSSKSVRRTLKLAEIIGMTTDEEDPTSFPYKELDDILSKEIDDMGEWTDNQKLRIEQQVNDLVRDLRQMKTKWQSMGTTERQGLLRRMKTVNGYEPHPLTKMSIADIIGKAELRIHDDGTLSLKYPPNPILRRLIPGNRNYQNVEVPDGETIRQIFDNVETDFKRLNEIRESVYERGGPHPGGSRLKRYPVDGEKLPHHSLYLGNYGKPEEWGEVYPSTKRALHYQYNDIAARILQYYVIPELAKIPKNEDARVAEFKKNNSIFIHSYLHLLTDPHAFLEISEEMAKSFLVSPGLILHDTFGHFALGNTFDRHGEWGNILGTINFARDEKFWQRLREIPELADLTEQDRDTFMRGLLVEVAPQWLVRVGYNDGKSIHDINFPAVEKIEDKIADYDGPIDELIDKLDPPGEQSLSSSRSTRTISLIDMDDEQLFELGKQSIEGVSVREDRFEPYSLDDIILPDDSKQSPQPDSLIDELFPTEVIHPTPQPFKPNQYKDLSDEELISKAVGLQRESDYPSNAILHELSLRGYEVYKYRVIGKKSYGGGWVEDYDSFSVRPIKSPTQEHLDRRKSLYSFTEEATNTGKPKSPQILPTLEEDVVDEQGVNEPESFPLKPNRLRMPRPQPGTNTVNIGGNNTGIINLGNNVTIDTGDINVNSEGVTTTTVNGRNVVIDVNGNVGNMTLNEVDKELADIQKQLAEFKRRRVAGSLTDVDYVQRRVDLANRKVALKLRKYAVPNGDATKGAPTVSYVGSSSRSTRNIDYYRREFNLSPEDLEFIKYTNASDLSLREEFGIDDTAIADIRSYVPPLDVIKEIDSLTEDDVRFLESYDALVSGLTENYNSHVTNTMAQRIQAIGYIRNSNLSELEKTENIKDIDDAFDAMSAENSELYFDRLNDAVLYTAPLTRRGFGWRLSPERIASLGLPEDYEIKLTSNQASRVYEMLEEQAFDWDEIEDFTGLTFDELKPLFPHVRIAGMIREQQKNSLNNPPDDGSSSRSMRGVERRQIVPISGDYKGQGDLHRKLGALLITNKSDLSDEEISAIKKYSYSQSVPVMNEYDPLSLMTIEELGTLSNLVGAERAKSLDIEFSEKFQKLIEQEFEIRANPLKYRGGGNERKLKREFVSAEDFLDPEMGGYAMSQRMHGGWLYPDGRIYPLGRDMHSNEFVYRDAFEDGLIRIVFSMKTKKQDSSFDLEIADTRPTREQYDTLKKLINSGDPTEVFFSAGKKSEAYDAFHDSGPYDEYSGPTYQYSNIVRNRDRKKLKEFLEQRVSWKKEQSSSDDGSNSRSKKDPNTDIDPDTDISDEDFDIIDDLVNKDFDSIEPVEVEPTDFRTRRALRDRREKFAKDAMTTILEITEKTGSFGRGPDADEVAGDLLEKLAKLLAGGDMSIIDEYEEVVKRKGVDVSAGKFFATSYWKYSKLEAEERLERQKGGNKRAGVFAKNIEAIEAKITGDDGGSVVISELAKEDDLSLGEIDELTARKIAFYDKFEKHLPLHAQIMGYFGRGLTARQVSKQTGIPESLVKSIKENIAYIGEFLGDIENWPLESLDKDYKEIAELLPGDDMTLNLDIARHLKHAKTYFENIDVDKDTGEISFARARKVRLTDTKNDDMILSFFEDGKPAPTRQDIAKALNISEKLIDKKIRRLRLETGKELLIIRKSSKGQKTSKIEDDTLLSFFEDDKPDPTIREIAEALNISEGATYIRLRRLRQETGRELLTGWRPYKESDDTILSFFEDGKPAPTIKEIAEALNTSEGAAYKRIKRLRKETGKKLSISKTPQNTKKDDDIILSFFEDDKPDPTIREIAEALNISETAASKRLWRLREKTGEKLLISEKLSKKEEILLSLFKDGELAPTLGELMKVTGWEREYTEDKLVRLRKQTGKKLNVRVTRKIPTKEKSNEIKNTILSFFEDGKPAPTLKQIVEATNLPYATVKERMKRLRRETGRKLSVTAAPTFTPVLEVPINVTLMSLFKNDGTPPTMDELVAATGLTPSSISGKLVRLRQQTGKDFSIARDLFPSLKDDISKTILSFFEEGKSLPTRQQLADATGLSGDGVTGRLQKLRKETGMDLSLGLTRSLNDDISRTILSLFADDKNPPTHRQLMNATGLSASALTVRLMKLRKETGEKLPLTIKRPFKGRIMKPKLEIIRPEEK